MGKAIVTRSELLVDFFRVISLPAGYLTMALQGGRHGRFQPGHELRPVSSSAAV
jgi:hypothetical protein